MQLIKQLVEAAVSQGSATGHTLLLLALALSGAVLAGLILYLARWTLAFFNPVSARATLLFTILFAACAVPAAALYFKPAVLESIPLSWRTPAGISTVAVSSAALAVAAAKLLRYALVACAWSVIAIVLASFLLFSKPPQTVLKERLPALERRAAAAASEINQTARAGIVRIAERAAGMAR